PGRFGPLEALVERIGATGRRTGIWVAPFLVGAKSRVFDEHRDWLIPGTLAGHNWDQDTYGLDATHPGAQEYLRRTFTMLRAVGIDYFKIDFIYAGALDGPRHSGADPITAYRSGVQLIRETIGPDAYLLGCGAPILPTVGLVVAMRVSAGRVLTRRVRGRPIGWPALCSANSPMSSAPPSPSCCGCSRSSTSWVPGSPGTATNCTSSAVRCATPCSAGSATTWTSPPARR